mmetsp:Transcript_28775/g.75505  ORF Transcript_28775/g.75505 Transcript_28775/m.75505 type:complete len:304 (+) Transcript_28775:63-974(+)
MRLGWSLVAVCGGWGLVAAAPAEITFSDSGWGCPFLDSSDSPCYSDACLESRLSGSISQECCDTVNAYCSASSSDPACSDQTLLGLFNSVCGASSSSVSSAGTAAWQELVATHHTEQAEGAVGIQTDYFVNCPFNRPYDNPCYNESCMSDGTMSQMCCDAIEDYCTEGYDDPACRNPDLGGLFFVFCNSSFSTPDWPAPKGPKDGKGGLLGMGGPVAQGLGTAALVGMSAVVMFFAYKHHQRRQVHNMEQQYFAQNNEAMAQPLLGGGPDVIQMAPPKYEEASNPAGGKRGATSERPPDYHTA